MKISKKIKIMIAAIMVAALPLLSIPAFASEDDGQIIGEAVEFTADAEIVGSEDKSTAAEEKSEPGDNNVFTALFNGIAAYSNDVITLFNFLISIIVAVCCKRGLSPKLDEATDSIKKTLAGLGESANRAEISRKESERESGERLELIEKSNQQIHEQLVESLHLLQAADVSKSTARTEAVLLAQIDMLYNIFISSALPEYQKENIGNQINKMKEVLRENEQ